MKMSKQEALDKIEELREYVENIEEESSIPEYLDEPFVWRKTANFNTQKIIDEGMWLDSSLLEEVLISDISDDYSYVAWQGLIYRYKE